jgi:diguanylate cyclase (GGDEF)-like protein
MKARRSQDRRRGGSLTLCPPDRAPDVASASMGRRDGAPHRPRSSTTSSRVADREVEDLFSSALPALGNELATVAREVDGIAKALKLDAVDRQVLRGALRPAISNVVRHVLEEKELRNLLLTDDLTGLYNRRAFFASATQQLKLAGRTGRRLLLFFFDLDNLKHINDRFGHREGDLALVRAAQALQGVFRDADILARLGGDEFAVLALEACENHEAIMLQRLTNAFRESNLRRSRYTLSLSVGVARFEAQHAVSLRELMERADRDMYEHKRKRPKLVRIERERPA